jgi:AbrB family looped-hinge helix DNA binding protein
VPKVTSKLQLTVPKAIADQYGIKPGDELQWLPAGEVIRVVPAGRRRKAARELDCKERLELFNLATERQRRREAGLGPDRPKAHKGAGRGWSRKDLYQRGLAD